MKRWKMMSPVFLRLDENRMNVIRNNLKMIILVIVGILVIAYASGYRLSPLNAAKSHFDVGRSAKLLGEVDYGWSIVYFMDTDEGTKTVIAVKSIGLWRAPVATYCLPTEGQINTIGSINYHDDNGQITAFAVQVTEPDVAYIEIGPENHRIKKSVESDNLLIFSWEEAIRFNDLNPIALSADGQLLYEYRYATDTNVIKLEDLKWYRIGG